MVAGSESGYSGDRTDEKSVRGGQGQASTVSPAEGLLEANGRISVLQDQRAKLVNLLELLGYTVGGVWGRRRMGGRP